VETAKSSQSLNPKIHFFPLEKSKKKLRIVHSLTGAKMDDDEDEDG